MKKVLPSEVSENTVVVSFVADNPKRIFLSLADTQHGVTESVTEMREIVNTI